MTDETRYYDNKRYEIAKPIDTKFWNFTVFNDAGKIIGSGNHFGNKRTADNNARKFIQWYRATESG